jgi:prepilin-type N-terminal cleavage/methylation domain-containing protein
MNRRSRSRGFTLLEMLVVVLLSLVLIGLLTTLYQMVGRTLITLQSHESSWIAEQFLRRQYLAVHPATVDEDLFAGGPTSMSFVSRKSARYGEHGPPVWVRYRYVPAEGRLEYREHDLLPWWETEGANPFPERPSWDKRVWWEDTIFAGVQSAEFSYFSPDAQQVQWQWLTQWHRTAAIPQLVRIQFSVAGERRMVVLETGVLSSFMPSGY